ncbi:hypothetical protein [Streptomyces sp. NEAU-YJ-81]|uniref:hypothetical protein n=1 Tax=Streptomyces sp. NEAU-YJ-81 TaxID=2820288 RepID=UPI001ABCBD93|nr:hypothetical protein [Streptomyces sp. NEAU-YJ-81]MBO3678997.1 hypothetical protein [Streptomyces sp. NEAU-YJ-81]
MDQGLAAVLGALVGALATGGGTYLTARSTASLHKRQARKEAYRRFLLDADPLCRRFTEITDQLYSSRCGSQPLPEGIEQRVAEIDTKAEALELHMVDVQLEGTSDIMNEVAEIMFCVSHLQHILDDWVDRFTPDLPISEAEWHEAAREEHRFQDHLMRFAMQAREHI